MDTKNPDYISIGRFAELVGTTRSRLLFYDKKGIFSPMQIVEKRHQAPNRLYSPQQVFDYNLLQLLQDAGISLEEGASLRNASVPEQLSRLHAHAEDLEKTIQRLRRMQSSLSVMQYFGGFVRETSESELRVVTIKRDLRFRFFPLTKAITRNSDLFLEALAQMNRVAIETEELLPGPFGTVYSAHRVHEHYPVKGFLVPYTFDCTTTSPHDYTLPGGTYLAAWALREIGKWVTQGEVSRRWLLENEYRRASDVIGWSMASEKSADNVLRLTEMMMARIIPGKTEPGCLPIEPGVDDLP